MTAISKGNNEGGKKPGVKKAYTTAFVGTIKTHSLKPSARPANRDEIKVFHENTKAAPRAIPKPLQMHGDAQVRMYVEELVNEGLVKGLEKLKANKQALVDIFADKITAPRYSVREAKMAAKAQQGVIASTRWVNGKELSELAQFKSTNKSAGASKWKSAGKIFSIYYLNEDLYPIYALDINNGFRPYDAMKEVIGILSPKKDNWGMAYWFASVNGYLGGKRPQDVLAINPEAVKEAARTEVEGIIHG